MKKDRKQKKEDARQKSGGLSSVPSTLLRAGFCPLSFVASAAMLTVIQPPISWSLLAWVSLVPFILACSPQAKPKTLSLAAYIVSLCYWLGNLYWVAPITLIGWASFCVYTAVLWPIVALCLRYCRMKKIPLFLAAGVLFVGAERLQGVFLGGFFWRFLAHSQYRNITIIQIADIFGAAGVSFLIAMVNGLLAELIILAAHKRWKWIPACAGMTSVYMLLNTTLVCAALVAAVVYGRWRINQSEKFVTAGPSVASLQSNVPQSVKREALRGQGEQAEKTSEEIFNELMQASYASAEAGAELIVWPETMVPATLNPEVLQLVEPAHPWKVFDQALRELSKDTAFVLVGAYGGSPDESKTQLAEKYNSAFLYTKDGQQYAKHYDKIHLVLFGEVLPFRKSFPLLFKLIMRFNPYGFDHSLDAGSEYTVFEMTGGENKGNGHEDTNTQRELDISKKQKNSSCLSNLVAENNRVYKFSVMICYEATIPAIARRFALDKQGRKQIHWLVNISNDGWFVRFENGKVLPSTELAQHAATCVFRAVENRLAIIRSVNTGISCLIDSLGRIKNGALAGTMPDKAMERKGIAGWFVDEMPIDKRVTLFSKHGQWLDLGCAACLVLLIILQMIGKWLNGKWLNSDRLNNYQSPITSHQLLAALLFACMSISLFGCNGTFPLQNTKDQSDSVPISNLTFQAFQIIQEGLSDADPQIRANTIEVVAATKQIQLMLKIHRLLNDESVPVKFSAVLAVGDLQYSLAAREVQLLLKDENENIRIAAAYAMTRLGHAEYFDVLRNAVASEDQTVRANAVLLMGKSGQENALKLLYWALQRKDSSDMVRFNAVEAIAMLGDERIFPKLWAIVYSGYADDRIIGIRAMGSLGTPKAKEVLITKLDDEILEVRLAAAEQLGKLKDPIGEPEVLNVFTKDLTATLDKKDLERVKKLTAIAIGQIGTNNLQKFLPQLLKDESKFVRIAAAKAVFQCAMRK